MKADPFSAGWGITFEELVRQLCLLSNIKGIGQQDLMQIIMEGRAKDARDKNIPEEIFAGMTGYGLKHGKNLLKQSSNEIARQAFTLELLLLMLIGCTKSGEFLDEYSAEDKLKAAFRSKYPNAEYPNVKIGPILSLGVEKELFAIKLEGSGKWKKIQYRRTNADHEFSDPQTIAEMSARAFRAGTIMVDMNRECIFSRELSLGTVGFSQMVRNVVNVALPDPEKPEKPFGFKSFHKITNEVQSASNERARRDCITYPFTWGSLMTFALVGPDEPRNAMLSMEWAKVHYLAGYSILWPYRMSLDPVGIAQMNAAWDQIQRELHAECDRAVNMSAADVCKYQFKINFGYGIINND